MSSISDQDDLGAADLAMIRGVLRTAGFRGVEADISSDTKRAASAFVRAEFHNGQKTKERLLLALKIKIASRDGLMPIEAPVRSKSVDRWLDEGGQ